MYRIKTILQTGANRIERCKDAQNAVDRFLELKSKKEIYSLDICIFLEKLVCTHSQEYQILRIG